MARKRTSRRPRAAARQQKPPDATKKLKRLPKAPPVTAGHLREALKENEALWSVNRRLRNTDQLPRFGLGGMREHFPLSEAVAPLEFSALLAEEPPANPHLLDRAVELQLLDPEQARALRPPVVWVTLERREARPGNQEELR
jgi:hypothetical protein